MDIAALKNEVATARGETESIEFKSVLDPDSKRALTEIVKDIVAIHNSGGGAIIFGLTSEGQDSGDGAGLKRPLDQAKIVDQVSSYTGHSLHQIVIDQFQKNDKAFDGWIIPAASVLVPFLRPGTWPDNKGGQGSSFSVGQIYVRHGAKSEPARYEDLLAWAHRVSEAARVQFAAEMQNVARLPDGYTVQAVPPNVVISAPSDVQSLRITDDPTAPGCIVVDKSKTHPFRQSDLVKALAVKIPHIRVTTYDIQCMRKVFASEIEIKDFVWLQPHSSPHCSESFGDWIIERLAGDPEFLSKTREKCKKQNATQPAKSSG